MNDKKNESGFAGTLNQTIAQEKAAKELIKAKFENLGIYSREDAELLSYRLAEILVLSKQLYIELFPEIAAVDDSDEDALWSAISGIRMHLLHTRDCIEDFEHQLIDLMQDDKKEEILNM